MTKIMILADDSSNSGFASEHGFSALVKHGGKRVLLDFGQKTAFENAKKIGIELGEIDFAVLSHGHFDHSNGLNIFEKGTLYCHPLAFEEKFRKDGSYIGAPVDVKRAGEKYDLQLLKGQEELAPGIVFSGEVPRTVEKARAVGYLDRNAQIPDPCIDDASLFLIDDGNVTVLTGCAHSGILNIVEKAGEFGKVAAVVGGLHTKDCSEAEVMDLGNRLGKECRVFAGHCTGTDKLKTLARETSVEPIYPGKTIVV